MFQIEVSAQQSKKSNTVVDKAAQSLQGRHWLKHNRRYLTVMFHYISQILLDCKFPP